MNNIFLKRFNVISIIISKHCNGTCDYCLITKDKDRDNTILLPFSNIEKLAEIINSFEIPEELLPYKISIQIVGGEPLIFINYLEQLMNYLIENCKKINFTFNIYTNGCACNSMILNKLKNYPVTLTFSLDEVIKADTHRFFQNRPMNEVTKEKLIFAIKNFPNTIRVNTVISELNYKGLWEIYQFLLKNNITKWGWGFMRTADPEEAQWQPENFNQMKKIINKIVDDAQNKNIHLYNILEYGQTKHKNMTSENIPIYLNMDNTISTLAGDNCFRIPIQDFTWDNYFKKINEWPELYLLNGKGENNLTECIHCHYREKHLKGLLNLPLSQCEWSNFLRKLYNKYYKR